MEAWLHEISRAYLDAADTMLVDASVTEGNLFHLGPVVCVKFRGLKGSKKSLEAATETALTSYVATTSQDPRALSDPRVAFAFCYLTAHFGLDLLTEAQVGDLMDFVVEKRRQLVKMTQGAAKGRSP
ncbi:MAG TPA: hypothetical protein VF395_16485 [Polyangiaceae bacterium]